MVRLALVLAMFGGCDYVLQMNRIDEIPAACGPYDSVRAIEIIGVTDPRSFSVSADEQFAMVFGTDAANKTRPIALQPTATGWEPHASFQTGLDNKGLDGANLAPFEPTPVGDDYRDLPEQPAINGWGGAPQTMSRYFWSRTSMTWTTDPNQGPINDPDYETRAGNVVLVVGGGGVDDRVRHTVLVKLSVVDPLLPNQILLSANTPSALPSAFNLLSKPDRTRPLNDAKLESGQAVLTESQTKLVYSAMIGDQSDLFATARTATDFGVGGRLEDVNTSDDEVEPWINADCSKLFFRRFPAGRPNDAGQIYVAE